MLLTPDKLPPLLPAYRPMSPGGGVMTLHDYGYLPPGFLKSFGVNFQIYTLPRCLAFFLGFLGESIVVQISFVMLIFLLFSIVFKPIVFGGGKNSRGKLLEGKPAVSQTMYQNTEKSCFQRKP